VTADERRSAALLFSHELRDGGISHQDLDRPDVQRAVRSGRWYAWPLWLERITRLRGWRKYADDSLTAFERVRRSVLGETAAGPPRFLVRIDEFPNYDTLDEPAHRAEGYRRFHETLHGAGVPYLIAVMPAVAANPLDPEDHGGRALDAAELELLASLPRDSVGFALHGWNHRPRQSEPFFRSELQGLDAAGLEALLDRGLAVLDSLGIHPRVFVPPFNTFGREQYAQLAQRFDVVCGGPESVARVGYHRTPLWRGDAVYMPSYPPLYARSADMQAMVEDLIARQVALWVPITLHWSWELETDFANLARLAEVIGSHARPWDDFLAAVDATRDAPAAAPA
jgi:Uncharacterized protein conserved in bacteria (DUF2334)